jgi:hypothetical protein
MQGATPYTRFGNTLLVATLLLLAIAVLLVVRKRANTVD